MAIADLPNATWTIDAAKTTVTATAKMMTAVAVPATFDVVSGSITIADGQVAGVEVMVDATSYTSSIAKRNKDVKAKGFLDAANYPTITFTASGGSEEKVAGEVTIKGTTVPLTFSVSEVDVQGSAATFTATTMVDRFAVGVDKSPAFVIAKDVAVEVNASATAAE